MNNASRLMRFRIWLKSRLLGILGSLIVGAGISMFAYMKNQSLYGSIAMALAIAFAIYVTLEIFDVLEDSKEGFMQ